MNKKTPTTGGKQLGVFERLRRAEFRITSARYVHEDFTKQLQKAPQTEDFKAIREAMTTVLASFEKALNR